MPQPYLPTFANKRYAIGFDALKERPAFASAIGRCIGLWSYVDNEVQGLFGILLGIDSPPVYRLFQLFHRWSHQRDALDTAAESMLSKDEMTVYSSLMARYASIEKQRTALAHGCFGISPDDEDLLFVIPVAKHVLWQSDILPKHLKGIIPADSHEGLKESLCVYRMADFDKLHSEMEQMWWDFFYFNSYLRVPHESTRAAEFQKLLQSPRIQQKASKTASQSK